MISQWKASRENRSLHDFSNSGVSERNESFRTICEDGLKDTQEHEYLILLSKPEFAYGLTDSEAALKLGMPKSERAGARRKGLMNKHELYFKSRYGNRWKERFWPLIVKNGNRSNINSGKKNSVWMLNHNRKMFEED